jgi:membrane-bound lytic murein transglycosylase D
VSRKLTAGEGQKLALYDVAPGDELSEVATAFGVTEAELARDNALDKNARLRPGMTLQVVVPEARTLDHIRHQVLTKDLVELVLVSGSPEFHAYFEGLKGKKRQEITVKRGDTLSGIGKRFGMSVGSMERVNRRSRKAPLLPGERLVVYTERGRGGSTGDSSPEPLGSVRAPRPDLLPSARASDAAAPDGKEAP